MAQQTTVHLIDDIDGTPASETVRFSVDGRAYEIDLGEVHVKELRSALEPYIAAARRPAVHAPVKRQQTATSREQGAAIRRWARQQGMQVGDRGRIPIEVQLRFDAAHVGVQG